MLCVKLQLVCFGMDPFVRETKHTLTTEQRFLCRTGAAVQQRSLLFGLQKLVIFQRMSLLKTTDADVSTLILCWDVLLCHS